MQQYPALIHIVICTSAVLLALLAASLQLVEFQYVVGHVLKMTVVESHPVMEVLGQEHFALASVFWLPSIKCQ